MQDGGVRTSGGGALPAFAARGGADRRGHRSAHGCLHAAAAASALSVKTGIDFFFRERKTVSTGGGPVSVRGSWTRPILAGIVHGLLF